MQNSLKINSTFVYVGTISLYFILVPFEDLLTSEAGTLAKYVAILIVASGLIITKGKIFFYRNTETYCMLLLMIISVLSIVWSTNRAITLHRLVAYLLLLSICLYVSTLDFTTRDYRLIKQACILGGIFVVLYLVMSGKLFGSGMLRLEISDHSDPNNFAAQLLLPLTCSFSSVFDSKKKWKILYVLLTCMFIFTVLLTGSRGCLLACIIFCVVYFVASGAYKKISILVGIILLFLLVWFVVLPLLPDEITWRLFTKESYLTSEASHNSRSSIWRIVISEVIPKMGIFGVGAGCSGEALVPYFGVIKGVHNTYLNMIVEYGVLGIPVFLFFLWSLMRKQIKKKKYFELSLVAAICVIIFFLDSFAKKFFWNAIMLVLISMKVDYFMDDNEDAPGKI